MIEIFVGILFLLVISQGAATIYMSRIIDDIIKTQKIESAYVRELVGTTNKNYIDIAEVINNNSRFSTNTKENNV